MACAALEGVASTESETAKVGLPMVAEEKAKVVTLEVAAEATPAAMAAREAGTTAEEAMARQRLHAQNCPIEHSAMRRPLPLPIEEPARVGWVVRMPSNRHL